MHLILVCYGLPMSNTSGPAITCKPMPRSNREDSQKGDPLGATVRATSTRLPIAQYMQPRKSERERPGMESERDMLELRERLRSLQFIPP